MRMVIAGGSGFLGRLLGARLAEDRHEITALTRGRTALPVGRVVRWDPDGSVGPWAADIEDAAVVINLAGESIAARRWTARQKQQIRDSRIGATRSLVAAIGRATIPPPVFISGSAVGYYGPLGDERATEDHGPGSDFLSSVCLQWEQEAAASRLPPGTRVTYLRTGLVLARNGGALPKMLPPFWFGMGGPVGSGTQDRPWIHQQDWVDMVRWAIRTPAAAGPLNVTAPNPVPNRTFARALGRVLNRPAWVRTPAFALRTILGEMADALLLSGQRAVPEKAERLGFAFAFRELDTALAAIFVRSPVADR